MREIFNSVFEFLAEINVYTVAIRLILATFFGGVIGLERGKHGSPAGLRTHILVCLGGALTSLLGAFTVSELGLAGDPLRVAAQVVSGIGFLGAGMIILKNQNMIIGLTTAAIMWTTAIIGIAVGIGFYSGAFFAVVILVFTAAVLTRIERQKKKSANIYMEINDLSEIEDVVGRIKELVPRGAVIQSTPARSGSVGSIGIVIITSELKSFDEFKTEIKRFSSVVFLISE